MIHFSGVEEMNTGTEARASIFQSIPLTVQGRKHTKSPFQTEVRKGQIGGWTLATRSFPLQSFGTCQGRSIAPRRYSP